MVYHHVGAVLLALGLVFNTPIALADGGQYSEFAQAPPELSRFVLSAVEANPRMLAARATLRATQSLKTAASRPLYNPELSFEAEDADAETRSIGISQTFDWGGKRQARTAVAEAEWLAAQSEFISTRWHVMAGTLSALAAYQASDARYQLAVDRERLMRDFSDLAGRRFAAGDLNQAEADLAVLASVEARMHKSTVGTEIAETRQEMRNLVVHQPAETWPVLSGDFPDISSVVDDPQSRVLQLPDVVSSQRRVELASAEVELRRKEQRPDPTVGLAGGEEDDKSLVALEISIPLYVRNRFDNEVEAAIALRSQAQQVADDVLRRAYTRLVSATERYELAWASWEDWQDTGQVSVDRRTGQLKQLWESGEISTTDYLVQLQQTLDVQESALDLREALWRAWFEWLVASGQIDNWLGQDAST